MKRLAALIVTLLSLPMSAQVRVRPVGQLRLNAFEFSFEASSQELFSIAVTLKGKSPVTCTMSPSVGQRWADSTERVILQSVNLPPAPDRLEYIGPDASPAADCSIRVYRTVTHKGSTYFFVVNQLATAVTDPQVTSFVAKIREVAAVTRQLSPARHVAVDSGGAATGTPVQTSADQPYFDFQVEKQVAAMPDNPQPRYPDMLRAAKLEGEVLAQFVVDTSGRAEMNTFTVLKSTHDLFTNSVKSALPNMRFYPAEVGGRKVKQLLQMPFVFGLDR